MTTHETDRPDGYDSVEKDEEMGGDDPTGERYDPGTGTVADVAETEPVEIDEPAKAELADETDRDPIAVDRAPESDPLQKLAPVGPDTAMDPGTGSYQDRWDAIQSGFIDDPRRTVESAGALVAEIWDETVRAITDEREGVDGRWQDTESSTDDLRVAMQDYRDLYARFMRFSSN